MKTKISRDPRKLRTGFGVPHKHRGHKIGAFGVNPLALYMRQLATGKNSKKLSGE
jgi:hypothetical protein